MSRRVKYDINDIKLETTMDYSKLESFSELNEPDDYVYIMLKDFYIDCDDYPHTRAYMAWHNE
jgi:hypothetical protein